MSSSSLSFARFRLSGITESLGGFRLAGVRSGKSCAAARRQSACEQWNASTEGWGQSSCGVMDPISDLRSPEARHQTHTKAPFSTGAGPMSVPDLQYHYYCRMHPKRCPGEYFSGFRTLHTPGADPQRIRIHFCSTTIYRRAHFSIRSTRQKFSFVNLQSIVSGSTPSAGEQVPEPQQAEANPKLDGSAPG